MNMKDRMHRGELYLPGDSEILEKQTLCLEKLYDFNATRPSEGEKRQKLLKEMFAEIGENCYIEPPFHANWGGAHVHFGNDVYANFNLTLVDDTHGRSCDVCPGRHCGCRRSPDSARAPGAGISVQRFGTHRAQLLDRCRSNHPSGYIHR